MSDDLPPPFDWAKFSARFPELVYVGEIAAEAFYTEAWQMFPAIVHLKSSDLAWQSTWYNLITAHLIKLNMAAADGTPPPDYVGRMNSASEGSVSVSTELPMVWHAAWFLLSRYGFQAYQMAARLRMARYYPGPRPYLGVGPTRRLWETP